MFTSKKVGMPSLRLLLLLTIQNRRTNSRMITAKTAAATSSPVPADVVDRACNDRGATGGMNRLQKYGKVALGGEKGM